MFIAKEKEPNLSPELADIINRSTGDTELKSNTDEVTRYKYLIMKKLTSNLDILRTLHVTEFEDLTDGEINGDLTRDKHIFNYMKLPNLKSVVKNYICFDVDDYCQGDYLIRRIMFRTIAHEDDVNTDWGVPRHDLMAIIIKNIFDWSNLFGIQIEKEQDVSNVTDDGYYYRELTYIATFTNNTYKRVNSARKGL